MATTVAAANLLMNFQSNLLNHKRKIGAPLGLRNLGNTCYLNSVLQCLTYTPPLANFCLKSQHSLICDSTGSDLERKRDCPFCILEKRIARSLSTDLTLDAPLKIQSSLRLFAEHFRNGRQEDAHEFLRYVIDTCHNTCLRLKKLRLKGSEPFNGSDTVVKDIFGGTLQSQVKCLSCGNDSNKVDEIMDLSLDILHSSSVKEAMVKFFQPEILDGNNKYKCENCKKLVAARKQMSILQAPNVLVIQLKRFEGSFGGKIDKSIAFEEVLVLSNFMCKTNQDLHPEYHLFASIVHSGYSPESGHYYAYIKDAMGRWYCCNDSLVTLSTLPEVLSEKVYILFFSRAKQGPASAIPNFASNGVKSRNGNCVKRENNGQKAAPVQKVESMKPPNEKFSGKNISIIHKNEIVSSGVQLKFNLGNSGSKRVSATENGNYEAKSQFSEKNGIGKDKENKENNMASSINGNGKKGISSLVNGNGEKGISPLVNGNGEKGISPLVNGNGEKGISPLVNGNGEKGISPLVNGNGEKGISPLVNGNGEKGISPLVNRNGVHKSKKVVPVDNKSRQTLASSIENVKTESTGLNSEEADTSKNNSITSKVTTGKESNSHKMCNGVVEVHSHILGVKRKFHEVDSCILFAKDAQSQAEVIEFKKVLMKDASLLLQSCGWSDQVYGFMHSRKRLRACESGSSPSSTNESKKKLIADAKPSYIPQIPESLKENLIERLKLFSKKKLFTGP